MRSSVLVLVAAMLSSAYGLVSGYHVEPVKATWSGWTAFQGYVSEVLTVNFDELDSAAGGCYCELFAGTKAGGGQYNLSVLTYPGGFPIGSGVGNGNVDHKWVKFKIGVDVPDSIVRGKKLEFRFTRDGGDSILYYYDEACGYDYGQMIAPYPPSITPSYGLAMRCFGRMKAVDSTYWGYNVKHVNKDRGTTWRSRIAAAAETTGVGWNRLELRWDWVQPESTPGHFSFDSTDDEVHFSQNSLHCKNVALLDYATSWAGTHRMGASWDTFSPPMNLFASVGSDSNFWARYVEAVVRRYRDTFDVYEIWNESNLLRMFWNTPDRFYTLGADTARAMCSLYVRLCEVAAQVIRANDPGAIVLVGSMSQVDHEEDGWIKGKEWLRDMYELADGVFWDGVGTHPYQGWGSGVFSISQFNSDAETLRAIMRSHGDYGELWNTELGWPHGDSAGEEQRVAGWLCKMFTAAKASEADPAGGYDQSCWYTFLDLDGCGVVTPRPNYSCRPGAFASGQTRDMLVGKRLNGRVTTGDTAVDKHTWTYEFEDTTALKKRTWVCWQDEAIAAYTPLPVRSDTSDTVALAYSGSAPTGAKNAEQSGWLHMALQPRPAFVKEKSTASRPDLEVDSVKHTLRAPDSVLAWVTNRGNRTTPRQSPGNQPYSTWAVLYANGDSLAQQVYTDTIGVNQQVTFRFNLGVAQPAPVLFAVKVNPAQTYVELGTDDNSGYRLKTQP
jgi:hypothetical protein